jgi:hypothetical protein
VYVLDNPALMHPVNSPLAQHAHLRDSFLDPEARVRSRLPVRGGGHLRDFDERHEALTPQVRRRRVHYRIAPTGNQDLTDRQPVRRTGPTHDRRADTGQAERQTPACVPQRLELPAPHPFAVAVDGWA